MSQSQIYFIYFFFLTHKQLNENPFKAYLYTECAYSGCEPQRRREIGAPSLTDSTRMRGILLRSRHAGEVT